MFQMRKLPRHVYRAFQTARNEGFLSLASSVGPFLKYQRKRLRMRVNSLRQAYYRRKYWAGYPSTYKLLDINPQRVEHLLVPRFQSKLSEHRTHIQPGEWDRRHSDRRLMWANNYEHRFQVPTLVRFDRYEFYRSAVEHFRNGTDWEETEIYRWFVEQMDTQSIKRYDTRENILSQLQWLDDLYDDMRQHGYRQQSELKGSSPPSNPPEHYEVKVNIGRDGEVIFDDGRHRFTIARLLGLDSIPVRVFVRHSEWQRIRSQVANATSRDELPAETVQHLEHPDMADIASF